MPRFHPVDIYVCTRIRRQRSLVAMSLTQFSEFVGLSIYQITKYERGTNRVSSSRLYEFAKVLNVPVSYFFEEMPSNALSGRPMSGRRRKGFGEAGTPFHRRRIR
jgi:transcriptional regulator with XRE-family HTH domain